MTSTASKPSSASPSSSPFLTTSGNIAHFEPSDIEARLIGGGVTIAEDDHKNNNSSGIDAAKTSSFHATFREASNVGGNNNNSGSPVNPEYQGSLRPSAIVRVTSFGSIDSVDSDADTPSHSMTVNNYNSSVATGGHGSIMSGSSSHRGHRRVSVGFASSPTIIQANDTDNNNNNNNNFRQSLSVIAPIAARKADEQHQRPLTPTMAATQMILSRIFSASTLAETLGDRGDNNHNENSNNNKKGDAGGNNISRENSSTTSSNVITPGVDEQQQNKNNNDKKTGEGDDVSPPVSPLFEVMKPLDDDSPKSKRVGKSNNNHNNITRGTTPPHQQQHPPLQLTTLATISEDQQRQLYSVLQEIQLKLVPDLIAEMKSTAVEVLTNATVPDETISLLEGRIGDVIQLISVSASNSANSNDESHEKLANTLSEQLVGDLVQQMEVSKLESILSEMPAIEINHRSASSVMMNGGNHRETPNQIDTPHFNLHSAFSGTMRMPGTTSSIHLDRSNNSEHSSANNNNNNNNNDNDMTPALSSAVPSSLPSAHNLISIEGVDTHSQVLMDPSIPRRPRAETMTMRMVNHNNHHTSNCTIKESPSLSSAVPSSLPSSHNLINSEGLDTHDSQSLPPPIPRGETVRMVRKTNTEDDDNLNNNNNNNNGHYHPIAPSPPKAPNTSRPHRSSSSQSPQRNHDHDDDEASAQRAKVISFNSSTSLINSSSNPNNNKTALVNNATLNDNSPDNTDLSVTVVFDETNNSHNKDDSGDANKGSTNSNHQTKYHHQSSSSSNRQRRTSSVSSQQHLLPAFVPTLHKNNGSAVQLLENSNLGTYVMSRQASNVTQSFGRELSARSGHFEEQSQISDVFDHSTPHSGGEGSINSNNGKSLSSSQLAKKVAMLEQQLTVATQAGTFWRDQFGVVSQTLLKSILKTQKAGRTQVMHADPIFDSLSRERNFFREQQKISVHQHRHRSSSRQQYHQYSPYYPPRSNSRQQQQQHYSSYPRPTSSEAGSSGSGGAARGDSSISSNPTSPKNNNYNSSSPSIIHASRNAVAAHQQRKKSIRWRESEVSDVHNNMMSSGSGDDYNNNNNNNNNNSYNQSGSTMIPIQREPSMMKMNFSTTAGGNYSITANAMKKLDRLMSSGRLGASHSNNIGMAGAAHLTRAESRMMQNSERRQSMRIAAIPQNVPKSHERFHRRLSMARAQSMSAQQVYQELQNSSNSNRNSYDENARGSAVPPESEVSNVMGGGSAQQQSNNNNNNNNNNNTLTHRHAFTSSANLHDGSEKDNIISTTSPLGDANNSNNNKDSALIQFFGSSDNVGSSPKSGGIPSSPSASSQSASQQHQQKGRNDSSTYNVNNHSTTLVSMYANQTNAVSFGGAAAFNNSIVSDMSVQSYTPGQFQNIVESNVFENASTTENILEALDDSDASSTNDYNAGSMPMINNYQILDKLGKGAQAPVFLAVDNDTMEPVAIKIVHRPVIDPKLLDSPLMAGKRRIIASVKREVAAMKRCRHPNLVQLLEVIDDSTVDHIFLIIEYMGGGCTQLPRTAVDSFTRAKIIDGSFNRRYTANRVIQFGRRLCAALQYLHERGVVHKDIKPENVLLRENGEPCLADFGISELIDRANSKGTPRNKRLSVASELTSHPLFEDSSTRKYNNKNNNSSSENIVGGDQDDDDNHHHNNTDSSDANISNNNNVDALQFAGTVAFLSPESLREVYPHIASDVDEKLKQEEKENNNSNNSDNSKGKQQDGGLQKEDTATSSHSLYADQHLNQMEQKFAGDVWSLGLTLFTFLTGRLPYPATSMADYTKAILYHGVDVSKNPLENEQWCSDEYFEEFKERYPSSFGDDVEIPLAEMDQGVIEDTCTEKFLEKKKSDNNNNNNNNMQEGTALGDLLILLKKMLRIEPEMRIDVEAARIGFKKLDQKHNRDLVV